MKVPYQFAGNEEMYKLALRLYLTSLVARIYEAAPAPGHLNSTLTSLIADDLTELGQELTREAKDE